MGRDLYVFCHPRGVCCVLALLLSSSGHLWGGCVCASASLSLCALGTFIQRMRLVSGARTTLNPTFFFSPRQEKPPCSSRRLFSQNSDRFLFERGGKNGLTSKGGGGAAPRQHVKKERIEVSVRDSPPCRRGGEEPPYNKNIIVCGRGGEKRRERRRRPPSLSLLEDPTPGEGDRERELGGPCCVWGGKQRRKQRRRRSPLLLYFGSAQEGRERGEREGPPPPAERESRWSGEGRGAPPPGPL
eukprot:scaffold15434_cov23-Tisochrysis_lutea.AAC.1